MKWTEKEIELLINNYENKGVSYCCQLLNLNRRRIISKANKLGLHTKVINKSESKNKKFIDFKLFKEFTKESVYILGLLWADGNINLKNKITSINCVEEDIDEVINIFKKTGEWIISPPIKKYHNNKEVKTQKKIWTSTWELCNILKEYGYTKKSVDSPDFLLSIIPNNLIKYWFRGYLDGDGCIRYRENKGSSIVFASSINQNWNFLIKLCQKNNFQYTITKYTNKLGGYSHFVIYKKNDVQNFCKFIYEEFDNIGFSRKYGKFLKIIEYNKNREKKTWSEYEKNWLKNNYNNLSAKECSKHLNKTIYSIYSMIKKLQ